jgi:hypothetical protein
MLNVLLVLFTLLAQTGAPPSITFPVAGQTLRGAVNVTGTSAVDGFFSAEVAFAYASDPSGTWFLIQASEQPVTEGLLAVWDTTSITDGEYNLRLRVTLQDGTQLETIVTGLSVRNYTPDTPTPSSTPAPTESLAPATLTPVATETPRPLPTPTPLPPNPAALNTPAIYASLGRGALIILLLFLVFGIFLRLRRN